MKADRSLVIDVWEGQMKIDEAVLKANGVAGISIRLNDMNGGHHMDTGFVKQWEEAKGFVRFPYFVYNPWNDGAGNFKWLSENLPSDARSVAIDIEVKYAGYPATKYAGEVVKFLNLCKSKNLKTIIYTAQWFLGSLSTWPKVDYWWAQYPSSEVYFKNVSTWDQLRTVLDRLDKPFNITSVPGTLKMWQFTGDYLILPGTERDIDVNIFYGNEKALADYFLSYPGTTPVEPPIICEPPVVIVTPPEPEVITPPSIPIFNDPNSQLYIFSKASYWKRPTDGPLVTPTYDTTKSSGAKDTIVDQKWINLLSQWNPNPKSMGKILDPAWGPSKGINHNGKLMLIALIYPGRNVVSVKNLQTGLDGEKWGELEYLDANSVPGSEINYIDRPDIVHRVYGSNTSWSWFDLASSPVVPILSFVKRYVEMKWLTPISSLLPKTVKVSPNFSLNVRDLPSIEGRIVGLLNASQLVEVHQVKIGRGGIWGRCHLGWIALRNNDKNLTDWQI